MSQADPHADATPESSINRRKYLKLTGSVAAAAGLSTHALTTAAAANSDPVKNTTFEILNTDAANGLDTDTARIIFTEHITNGKIIQIEGTIIGANSCTTAILDKYTYDSNTDTLTLHVKTKDTSDPNQFCTQALKAIDYMATLNVSEYPSTLQVYHTNTPEGTETIASKQWQVITDNQTNTTSPNQSPGGTENNTTLNESDDYVPGNGTQPPNTTLPNNSTHPNTTDPLDDNLHGGRESRTTHTLTLVKRQGASDTINGDAASYKFTVDGSLKSVDGNLEDTDTITNNTASGRLTNGEVDSYTYTGSLTQFKLNGKAAVYRDGQAVSPTEITEFNRTIPATTTQPEETGTLTPTPTESSSNNTQTNNTPTAPQTPTTTAPNVTVTPDNTDDSNGSRNGGTGEDMADEMTDMMTEFMDDVFDFIGDLVDTLVGDSLFGGESGQPPGHGGTPPGHGGTPPGLADKKSRGRGETESSKTTPIFPTGELGQNMPSESTEKTTSLVTRVETESREEDDEDDRRQNTSISREVNHVERTQRNVSRHRSHAVQRNNSSS